MYRGNYASGVLDNANPPESFNAETDENIAWETKIPHRRGYDFKTGDEIWKMSGGGDIQIPTPIVGKDLVFFNSAHGKVSPVLAIQTNAKGDITMAEEATTGEYVKWYKPRGGSYMGTMLLYGEYLYNAGWNGKLICYNAKTGEEMYGEKVGSGNSYTSSPVAANGISRVTQAGYPAPGVWLISHV